MTIYSFVTVNDLLILSTGLSRLGSPLDSRCLVIEVRIIATL